MTDELLRQLDCFDQARRRLEQRRSPQTKQFFTQGYDADLGGYIGIDSQGNRLVLPSISTGSVEIGTSALCRSSSIDVMPASVSERPVEDASFLTTNPKIYFTRFLLTETPDEENTRVILGGFSSPIVLDSGIPRYLDRCPGAGDDPDDLLLPTPVCRQVDHERRYVLHNRYPRANNPDIFEQQYFLFIVPAGRCLPRLRPANSSNTFFGTVSYKSTGWMIERGPLKFMSPAEMERPAETGGGSIRSTFLARGDIWDGSSYRDSANGQIPDTTRDLIGPGGQFVANALAPGSYAFFASYRDGVEEFPGMLVFGDLVVYEISRTDTGEIFPNPEEEADISPPDPQLRENEIATAMALQDGKTYVHIAHTPSCDGPQYEVTKSWILDPEGNFLDASGAIILEAGQPGAPQAFPSPEVAETLYRIELFSELPPVPPVGEPACEADFKDALAFSLNRKGDAIALSSDISVKTGNDLTQPETRFGPGFNTPNVNNGIRFNDPSSQLLKPEFSVLVAELELSEVEGVCNTQTRDTRTVIVPGLNIDQPQPDTDWPHNGWGFHWLLTGCYQKR